MWLKSGEYDGASLQTDKEDMMPDIRRVLKVVFTPDRAEDRESGTIAIRSNGFMFTEIGPNQFLVMTPSEHYGGEQEMQDDLNDNALGGKYHVLLATRDELREFDWNDGLLHN